MSGRISKYGVVFAAWLPFFAIWVLFGVVYGHYPWRTALVTGLFSMGSASLLGIGVWHVCQRWPWPLSVNLRFYGFHILVALAYAVLWLMADYWLEVLRRGRAAMADYWSSPALGWELLMGMWLYGVFAGVSYAVQTRNRLQEKEMLVAKAERLMAEARLDAVRARLHPHFLFNALHTLAALVKFRPALAEGAIERLGDMLRYTLKEDGRELVEFSEEYDFTRQYLAFEQLRYEERLKVEMEIAPESFEFELLPFSLQTLAENAVRHAISVRPEGVCLWISSKMEGGDLVLCVRDDGPGCGTENGESHQFGLHSLRERLRGAFGERSELATKAGPDGFEARFIIPANWEESKSRKNLK